MANPNYANLGPQLTDFDGSESSFGLFDDGSDDGINAAGKSTSGGLDNLLDPTGLAKGFYNDFMGYTSQEREFEQQMKMTQYENEWNSAAEQMKRAKAAGINPLTAAGGIAGNGSGSVAAAGGSAVPSTAPADAVGNFARLGSDNAAKNAAAEQSMSVARNADRLADAQILKDAASSASLLTSAGVPEIAAMELGLSLARNGLQGFSAAFNADNYCRKFDLEMDEIDALINTENQRFESLQQQSNLYRSEAQLANERAMHENILKQYDQKKLEIAKQYEAMFADSDTLQQFILAQKFGVNSSEYKAYMNFIQDKFYSQGLGTNQAEVATMYNKFYQQFKATAEWRPYLDMMDEKKEQVYRLLDLCYGMSDSAITNVLKAFFLGAGYVENKSILTGEGLIPSGKPPIENGNNLSR